MPHRRAHAFSVIELLAVLAVVLAMVAIFIRPAGKDGAKTRRIRCVNNQKNLGLAARVRAQDESRPIDSATNAAAYFRSLAEHFSSPALLVCPEDKRATASPSMTNLSATNISYFASVNALAGPAPQAFLFGDDNVHLGDGRPVSGSLRVRSNTPWAWTSDRHMASNEPLGIVAINDGSVQMLNDAALQKALAAQGAFTNVLLFR